MARLRGRDVATLGALGAAALALKKGKGEDKTKVDAGPQEYKGIKGISTGRLGEAINPETGDKYKTLPSQEEVQDIQEGPSGRSAARKVAPTRTRASADDAITRAQYETQDLQEGPAFRSPAMEGITASGVGREARGRRDPTYTDRVRGGMKKGGMLKNVDAKSKPGLSKLPEAVRNKMGYKRSGGKVSSASKRADGICKKGKTKGRFV